MTDRRDYATYGTNSSCVHSDSIENNSWNRSFGSSANKSVSMKRKPFVAPIVS